MNASVFFRGFFEEKYDVKEENLLQLLELRSSGQVKVEHLTTLRGYLQSIKDGEVSPNELFGKKTDVPDDPIREKPADPLKGAKKITPSWKDSHRNFCSMELTTKKLLFKGGRYGIPVGLPIQQLRGNPL